MATFTGHLINRDTKSFDEIADECDDRSAELDELCSALLDPICEDAPVEIYSHLMTGEAWVDGDYPDSQLLHISSVDVSAEVPGRGIRAILVHKLAEEEMRDTLVVVQPEVSGPTPGAAKQELDFWEGLGFRALGSSKFLGRAPASFVEHSCHHSEPDEALYETVFSKNAKASAVEATRVLVDNAHAKAVADGFTGSRLNVVAAERARALALALGDPKKRLSEEKAVAHIRSAYPAAVAKAESEGTPAFMMLGTPPWFLEAAESAARSFGFPKGTVTGSSSSGGTSNSSSSGSAGAKKKNEGYATPIGGSIYLQLLF